MKLVIEMDKADYEKIKKTSFVENTETMLHQSLEDRKGTMMLFRVMDAIKDGTPIPKYGRLIDANELLKNKRLFQDFDGDMFYIIHEEAVINAPVIIEADKKGEDADSD